MNVVLKYKLPTMVPLDKHIAASAARPTMLEAGGLANFGPSVAEGNQRGAAFVDRILRGAKPADLPIEQPTKFELGINLKTAMALGITVPQSLLLRADEVIQ
jgi:putative tryptophan/tyrosine transport system substrate-binding protein